MVFLGKYLKNNKAPPKKHFLKEKLEEKTPGAPTHTNTPSHSPCAVQAGPGLRLQRHLTKDRRRPVLKVAGILTPRSPQGVDESRPRFQGRKKKVRKEAGLGNTD